MRLKPSSLSAAILACALCALAPVVPGATKFDYKKIDAVFRAPRRHLFYVALPSTNARPGWIDSGGIVALDSSNCWNFVMRIPTWNYASSMNPEHLSGIAANPVTNLLYVSARGRLAAIDLATARMVWTTTTAFDGHCCERLQVTPKDKILLRPA